MILGHPVVIHWFQMYQMQNCERGHVLCLHHYLACSWTIYSQQVYKVWRINWPRPQYTVSQKKTSHFNFLHNFAICWDIFTIFEAPCSGIIAGWCNLLHTHHQCEAFTWRDVTHDFIQAGVRRAHRHQTSDFIPLYLWPLNSPDLHPVHYSFWSIMQEKVYQTHIANIDELQHRLVQVWAELDHAVSMRVTRVWKLRGDILTIICVEFACSPLGYLLNSWPM